MQDFIVGAVDEGSLGLLGLDGEGFGGEGAVDGLVGEDVVV